MALLLFAFWRAQQVSQQNVFKPYGTEREIQSLMSVKVQAPFDAVGIGTSAVLSSIPVG